MRSTDIQLGMQGQMFSQLVYESIANKYEGRTLRDVERVASGTLESLRRANSERAALSNADPTRDFETDVVNQVRCLYAIEFFWRFKSPGHRFVQKVHAVASGVRENDVCLRRVSYVPDFGGEIPWPVREIKQGLASYHKLLSRVVLLNGAPRGDKAEFLGQVYADLIQIHPFTDANGRTARMLVQYCLRHWGDRFVVIPKVRNCAAWRVALASGIHGDYAALGEFLTSRIKPGRR